MKKFWIILPILMLAGCVFGPAPAPTPDMGALATQMWVEMSVQQTLIALQATPTPEPTPTLEPTPTSMWISTPLPAPADPANYAPVFNPVSGMEVVYVPAGNFLMGSADTDSNRDIYSEIPQHQVYLDAFWISKTQVTNGMFNACVNAGACKYSVGRTTNPNFLDPLFTTHPVVYISWDMAQTYCAWTGGRLPTEAEWEKAARGTDGRIFPWGDEPANDRLANFDDKIHKTTPVGSYPAGASPYGLQDIAGNAWEWVDDWYSLDYYRTSIRENPPGPDSGDRKVLRGGSWFSITDIILKTHIRKKRPPEIRDYGTGFRCAFSAE